MSGRPSPLRVIGEGYRPGRVTLLAEAPDGTRYEVAWTIPRHALRGVIHAMTTPDAAPDPYRGARRLPRQVADGGE
jgi:hypothetical protein